jgi:hypothetical protein
LCNDLWEALDKVKAEAEEDLEEVAEALAEEVVEAEEDLEEEVEASEEEVGVEVSVAVVEDLEEAEEDLEATDADQQRCMKLFVLSVESHVRFHSDLQVTSQFIAVIASDSRMTAVLQEDLVQESAVQFQRSREYRWINSSNLTLS